MTRENINKMNEYYETVEEYIQKGRLEDAAVNIRHILEMIVDDYVVKFAPEAIFFKTMDKINTLEQKDCLNNGTIATLHQLRKIANKGAHGDGDKLSVSELSRAIIPLRYEMERMKCDEETLVENMEEDEEEKEKREAVQRSVNAINKINVHIYETHKKLGINPTFEKLYHLVYGAEGKVAGYILDYKLQENLHALRERVEVDLELDELVYYEIIGERDQFLYQYDKETGKSKGCWVEGSERQKSLLEILLREENTEELPIEYCNKKVKEKYSQFFLFIDCYRTNVFETYENRGEKFNFIVGDDEKIKWLCKQNKCLYIAPDISKEHQNAIMNAYTLLFFANRINPSGKKVIRGNSEGLSVVTNSNSDISFAYLHNDDENVIMIGHVDRVKSTFDCKKCENYEKCMEKNLVCDVGGEVDVIREYPIHSGKESVIEKYGRVSSRSLDIDYKDLYEYFLVNNLFGVGEKEYVQASYESIIGIEPCVINLGYAEEGEKKQAEKKEERTCSDITRFFKDGKNDKIIKIAMALLVYLAIVSISPFWVIFLTIACVAFFCYKINIIEIKTLKKIGIIGGIVCIIYVFLKLL